MNKTCAQAIHNVFFLTNYFNLQNGFTFLASPISESIPHVLSKWKGLLIPIYGMWWDSRALLILRHGLWMINTYMLSCMCTELENRRNQYSPTLYTMKDQYFQQFTN